MERSMSVEEKIKRAEEIYAKRHEQNLKHFATVNVNEKKNIKLFRKMIIQVITSLCIYLIIININNGNYVFSDDFINKTKEILSTDIKFEEIYNTINLWMNEYVKIDSGENNNLETNKEENELKSDNNIGGADEVKELTQEEQDIENVKNTTTFIKPIEGIISSKYGIRDPSTPTVPKNHTGTDIAANLGTKIKSSTEGEVVQVSSEGDYGKHIKIQIENVSVIYAHCNDIYVQEGEKISQGQEIAEVGSTGNSTGPHLHFEIRIDERTVDPELILEL